MEGQVFSENLGEKYIQTIIWTIFLNSLQSDSLIWSGEGSGRFSVVVDEPMSPSHK